MFDRKFGFILMKKGIHIMNPKKPHTKRICRHTTFYSIINMSSCRKLEIQTDFPKITKISGQKYLTMFISSCFNNYSIEF